MGELDFKSFQTKIDERSLDITVVGLGKMGLPIAMVFAHHGYRITGYDISEELVSQLNSGSTILTSEPGVPERLQESVKQNKFHATTDIAEAVKQADVIITIIPVLDNDLGQQNLDILKSTYRGLAEACSKDVLFIQESTLAPGTSKYELWPILEEISVTKGLNYGLVFAPERTLSGRAIKDIEENYPKLLGGISETGGKIAAALYDTIATKGVIQLSDATTAEAVKTFKGAYRDANIALANQFAIMADRYGVDILEVIDAANTEPFSHIHTPGIGVGGHCIPVYPQFLIYSSRQQGYEPDLLVESRQANDYMVDYAIDSMNKYGDEYEQVLILGLAYRGGVKEFRKSPTLRLLPSLRAIGKEVHVTDPLYTASEIDTLFGEGTGIDFDSLDLGQFDTIFIVTDHEEFKKLDNYRGKQVFDGRYILDQSKIGEGLLLQPGRFRQLDKKIKPLTE